MNLRKLTFSVSLHFLQWNINTIFSTIDLETQFLHLSYVCSRRQKIVEGNGYLATNSTSPTPNRPFWGKKNRTRPFHQFFGFFLCKRHRKTYGKISIDSHLPPLLRQIPTTWCCPKACCIDIFCKKVAMTP